MQAKTYRSFTKSAIPALLQRFAPSLNAEAFLAAGNVFPTRINNHVADDLIDWSKAPKDPLFRLSIPQPEMLRPEHLALVLDEMRRSDTSRIRLRAAAEHVRRQMNPHPAGQKEENVPRLGGQPVQGLQHKYRETVLFFPSEAQYCHAYCTYCFRWAQFTSVGSEQAFKTSDVDMLQQYVASHPQVSDVLFTGGDPMVMPTATLKRYIEPLIGPKAPPNLDTIRIGSKSLAWWPYRYVSDPDSQELLRFFSEVVKSGKHLTIQAHFSHPREVEHPVTQEAVRLIRMTGAHIRSQAPLIRHVNDDPEAWTRMWKLQTKIGIVPYYMFVERDTGARDYFSVPLSRAVEIYDAAYSQLPGTAKTVRGPSMSASPGKVCVVGKAMVHGELHFLLVFLQARNPEWTKGVFFAKYDPEARWLDDLRPAFGADDFFYAKDYERQKLSMAKGSSGQLTDQDWITMSDGWNVQRAGWSMDRKDVEK
ncbi:hypothetical protein CKM354_000444800 [Cercospora kikuchii]|uniref:L-lysine 2,3-aminomutase n=1 Tax=Cercospora kikuchii TaxID=84275 RepID=A0A9P3FEM2_9PEZI|nr:uncharacterized protein CKM354_000444800 [Cercospora kikuchii]GIZ41132.1 hypothetical protein CKM354_000444800 [Cercospora kikuchii]